MVEVMWHWAPSGRLEGPLIHAGTWAAAKSRRAALAAIPWDAEDLADEVPSYWREGPQSRFLRLELVPGTSLANKGRPVRDDEVYGYKGEAVRYRNAFEDQGSVSVVAPRDFWSVVEQVTPDG